MKFGFPQSNVKKLMLNGPAKEEEVSLIISSELFSGSGIMTYNLN